MRKIVLFVVTLLFGLTVFLPASTVEARGNRKGEVVVANRDSGTISVIDVQSGQVVTTVELPAGDNTPEPMYVTYSKRGNHVFVGDRANNRVVVFDADDYAVVTTIEAGAGVFHMWVDARDRQLWVNNDIDNTATVINPRTLSVIATVSMPADLVADGYKPHDVILNPIGRFAYVTMVGDTDPDNDYLVQFSTRTFMEVNRAEVGKDPHVSLTQRNNRIYVPAQNSNLVSVFNRRTLRLIEEVPVPGAHGAGMSPNGKVLYTTNLPGNGEDGLFAIDTRTNTILGTADTPFPVPHNVVVARSNKLFLTHSGGTSDKVTIYGVSNRQPIPTLIGEVTVGLNPFGLAYVP
jgi:DNA-binding beta-propeller fold protein YncE